MRLTPSSYAEEAAPSSQYGVKSPVNEGRPAPYFFSNAENSSSVVAMASFGETCVSFQFLT